MSKSGRTRQLKEAERLERQQRQFEEKKAMRRMDRLAAIVSGAVTGVVILALAIYLLMNSLLDNGYFMRKKVSISSDNYQINNAMMSYYFYEEYRDFINRNYSDLDDMGLKSDKSLKKQDSYYKDGTWFDHFMSVAEDRVRKELALAEEAKLSGVKLDDEDKKIIDDTVENLKSRAESSDKTELEYYAYLYGRGVTEKDIRDCLELSSLSEKYYNILKSEYNLTDEEYDKLYSDNIAEYSAVDVTSYAFNYDEFAEAAKSAQSYEEYKSAACDDAAKNYSENYGTEIDRDFAAMFLANLSVTSYPYGQNETVDKSAFKDGVKDGDTFWAEEDGKTVVYYIIKAPYKQDYSTVNVRVIYYSNSTYGDASYAQKSANSALNSWSEGNKTSASFAVLAKENSEDYESASNGGLYENLQKNVLDSAAEEWAFDEKRTEGDCEVVAGDEGCYLMYYEGNGMVSWKSEIFSDSFSKYMDDKYASFIEKYNIASDKKKLKKISI